MGTETQKAELLPPIYTGKVRTWQPLSEPQAGSDLANVRTSAVRNGNHYVLNGQKVYVGSDHGTDRLWVIAMTGRVRHAGINAR
jgi:3-oxocholest-4-en-26-oyl-CoA dehydrogenase alpha subunit